MWIEKEKTGDNSLELRAAQQPRGLRPTEAQPAHRSRRLPRIGYEGDASVAGGVDSSTGTAGVREEAEVKGESPSHESVSEENAAAAFVAQNWPSNSGRDCCDDESSRVRSPRHSSPLSLIQPLAKTENSEEVKGGSWCDIAGVPNDDAEKADEIFPAL